MDAAISLLVTPLAEWLGTDYVPQAWFLHCYAVGLLQPVSTPMKLCDTGGSEQPSGPPSVRLQDSQLAGTTE